MQTDWSLNQLVAVTVMEGIANEICSLYHGAASARKNCAHTISVDEMTGIQPLEHFDVATGRMETPYLNRTGTEEDFVKAVRKLV